MLIEHQHPPGRFDPGHCRDCARESDLLDHYDRVQREELGRTAGARVGPAGPPLRRMRPVVLWRRHPAGRPRPARPLTTMESPTRYELRVNGVLDSGWSAWFNGLQVSSDNRGQTTIAGPAADQAVLHGLLAKIRDLGLELLEVRRTDPD
jgi:hypothetical protein